MSAFASPLQTALWGVVVRRPRAQVTLSRFNTGRFEGPAVRGGHQGVWLGEKAPFPLFRSSPDGGRGP